MPISTVKIVKYVSQVINSRHFSFLTVNQETNTSMSPGWASDTIFSVAQGQVLRRQSTLLASLSSSMQ